MVQKQPWSDTDQNTRDRHRRKNRLQQRRGRTVRNVQGPLEERSRAKANDRVRNRQRKHPKAYVLRRQRGHLRRRRRPTRRLPKNSENQARKNFGGIRTLCTARHGELPIPNKLS